jgi:hypothetical protein
MNRRRFLQMLGMAAPVAAVAPTYFFAPVGGWHSDVIAHPPTLLEFAQMIIVSTPSERRRSWLEEHFKRGMYEELIWIANPAQAKVIRQIGGFKLYGGNSYA